MNKLNIKIHSLFFFVSFLIILLFTFLFVRNIHDESNKKLYISIDNVDVTEKYITPSINSYPQNIKIETEYGYNTLLIYETKIACTDSNCKDKICVNRKFIHKNFDNEMIVCAPHKLIIYYK